jgi:hypothetical protein
MVDAARRSIHRTVLAVALVHVASGCVFGARVELSDPTFVYTDASPDAEFVPDVDFQFDGAIATDGWFDAPTRHDVIGFDAPAPDDSSPFSDGALSDAGSVE